jgi:hypothetical protein
MQSSLTGPGLEHRSPTRMGAGLETKTVALAGRRDGRSDGEEIAS